MLSTEISDQKSIQDSERIREKIKPPKYKKPEKHIYHVHKTKYLKTNPICAH